MLLESVYLLLQKVPAIFYAITTGSTITLAGLYMQNRSESERNTERLRHDALMRDREREMTLKRDVYLQSAETLARAQNYLANFSRDGAKERETLIKGINADLNKVHIVGSLSTVQAIVAANEVFVRAIADLSLSQLPITRLREDVKAEEQVLDQATLRRDDALGYMRDMDRSGSTGSPFWAVQDEVLREAQGAIEGASERLRARKVELAAQESLLTRQSAKAGMAFGALVFKANVAIRRELEQPLDADAYLDMMARSQEALEQHIDHYHARTEDDQAESGEKQARRTFTKWLSGARQAEMKAPLKA